MSGRAWMTERPETDQRIAAALAHALCLSGFWVVAPFIVWLVYRDRSDYVAFHAIQAMSFQAVLFLVTAGLAALAFVTCGLSAVLVPITAVLGGLMALFMAFSALSGDDRGYPLLEDVGR